MSSPVPSPSVPEVPDWQPRAEELMRIIYEPYEEVEVIAQGRFGNWPTSYPRRTESPWSLPGTGQR